MMRGDRDPTSDDAGVARSAGCSYRIRCAAIENEITGLGRIFPAASAAARKEGRPSRTVAARANALDFIRTAWPICGRAEGAAGRKEKKRHLSQPRFS
jgi:hypothetical protein